MNKTIKYPLYVISKGRWKNPLTVRALEKTNTPYKVVIEESEYDNYASSIGPENLIILDESYKRSYNYLDDKPDTFPSGSGPARNFVWYHAVKNGHDWHWILDDNIEDFNRLHNNQKPRVRCNAMFRASEDFVQRYDNLAIAGFNYYNFVKATDKAPPYRLNTRIYSCLLIRNDIPFRWRGRYNEDTIICLDVMKEGWATCLFNAFLAGKVTTQRMKGGNTDTIYKDGTLEKSQMLADTHPDVAKVTWRFNRWHHYVDYKPFRNNDPKRKKDFDFNLKTNNFGMKLIDIEGNN